MKVVTVYTRRGCTLCRQAMDVVDGVRARKRFELRVVDVDRDLRHDDPRRSGYVVAAPVVEVDGAVAFEGAVGAEELERWLGGEERP
jgi:glutaredoxin